MKVTFGMRVDANLSRGGAEIAVDRYREHLHALGVKTEVLTPLTQELGDVVHFFGCYDSHWSPAEIAMQKGVPYVCSPIFSSMVTEAEEKRRALRHRLTRRFPRLQRKLFRNAAALIFPTERERRRLVAYYGIDHDRFRTVTYGVDERFFEADGAEFRREYGVEGDFVLSAGAFSHTKNQLGVIRALKGLDVQLVLIGHEMDPAYLEQCRKEAGPKTLVIGKLPFEGNLLPSAYAAAAGFVLPSYNETFCFAAMEALAGGTPVVLGNRWEADELFGDLASYVDPDDREALKALGEGKRDRLQAQKALERFTWPAAASELAKVYHEVLGRRS